MGRKRDLGEPTSKEAGWPKRLRKRLEKRRRQSPPVEPPAEPPVGGEFLARVLKLHNAERRGRGLRDLKADAALTKAAQAHAEDMLANGYFSHDSPDGTTACERVEGAGYAYGRCGENIAWGSGPLGAPEKIVEGWMNSPGHRANILNAEYEDVGVGAVEGRFAGYEGTVVYVVDFGSAL